ncbi:MULTISPECIES: hypothetical protein [Enterobacteriaceae]|uniref:hypothetical protein n=1 Tax=Enterobacteriaceae TaxID=543 RepID=UPI0011E99309|nr:MULTISPECIES: hypothetical protein [Enterobacteriaceae]EKS6729978.1 hypothetical protein [Enterobacter mori]EES0030240.1 hypothetical protein [Escherichia coli]MCD9354799.1 hypothetical protein [Klebsiella pneumoniae]MCD9375828.1 hypothetical protein [Klebsiella pneumoniae]MCD9415511.1 hypothetical protein [Klebsiella pneumoniae]
MVACVGSLKRGTDTIALHGERIIKQRGTPLDRFFSQCRGAFSSITIVTVSSVTDASENSDGGGSFSDASYGFLRKLSS